MRVTKEAKFLYMWLGDTALGIGRLFAAVLILYLIAGKL